MIIKTGSPMFEVLNTYRDRIDKSNVLVRLGLKESNFFLVSGLEKRILILKKLLNLIEFLNTISELYKLPVIFSTHPRTKKRIDQTKVKLNPLIQILSQWALMTIINFKCAKAVLSDSGTITEGLQF